MNKNYAMIVFILGMLMSTGQVCGQPDIQLDPCEETSLWKSAGGDYGRIDIETVEIEPKEGKKCLKFTCYDARITYVFFSPEEPWDKHEYLCFWLKAEGAQKAKWNLRIEADSQDGVFSLNKYISLDFEGWTRVRLRKDDFSFHLRKSDQPVDWSKIIVFAFGMMEGENKPTIYLDDIRYEEVNKETSLSEGTGDIVPVNNCEEASSWKADGRLDVSARPESKQEGEKCLYLHYSGSGRGSATTPVPVVELTRSHALVFKLRGPGATSTAKFIVRLTCVNGASFQKVVSITNFDWADILLFPEDFQKYPNPHGELPDWGKTRFVGLEVDNQSSGEEGNILVDAVEFRKMVPSGEKVSAVDERFWWWNGGFDPFCAMHAIYADWPHLESQPDRVAPLKFSEFILSPLIPYKVYIHNDNAYEHIRLTITDWELNPVKVFNLTTPRDKVIELEMIAPARTGTYLFNLECYQKENNIPQKYQTGIMVLAKRLAEPQGIWGIHGYIGTKGQKWPHHDLIIKMFQSAGITCLRERYPIPIGTYSQEIKQKEESVFDLAREHNIKIDLTIHLADYMEEVTSKGLSPDRQEQFAKDIEEMTRTWKGKVAWYELGNEHNDRPISPYADALKIAYAAAKRGDPDCKFTNCGAHVVDKWQYQLWDMEKKTGVSYFDAFATHLYPPGLESLESSLRIWIEEQGQALVEKGMLMTETGWCTFDFKTQSLLKHGMLSKGYSGERECQVYYAMYGPVMLGEHLKMKAKLYGVYYFQAMQTMGDFAMSTMEELYVWATGHFVGKWNSREITVARPMVYTHNAQARLLTHEVELANIPVIWDKKIGNVESYAFCRPGETIVTLWVGLRAGMRAEKLSALVEMPKSASLILSVDLFGNEKVLTPSGGFVKLELTREPLYLRFLEGIRIDNVFLNINEMPKDGYRIIKGIPEGNAELIEGISRDRNLPEINDVVPLDRAPMVLYSKVNNTVYIVGRTEADVKAASAAFETARK